MITVGVGVGVNVGIGVGSGTGVFNAAIAIVMTCIVLTTILFKPKRKLLKYFGVESVLLVACYLIATIYTFQNP